jgi:integrase
MNFEKPLNSLSTKSGQVHTSLRLKDLRHCTAQWATNEGVAEAKVQVFMRHANPSMTRRYGKQKDRGEVATAVADAMLRSA